MARGNQRDKARAKNLDKLAQVVCIIYSRSPFVLTPLQKSKNTMTGSQHARAMEDAAAIMRDKQKKGAHVGIGIFYTILIPSFSR